jgi:sterol desaturase/sphingolipid hydroxylase (fatty acid hydroxylase superfamily)
MGYFFHNLQRLFWEPLSGESRFYWLYCLTSLAIAGLVYVTHRSRGTGSLRGFVDFCFPRGTYAHPSAIVDYKLLVANFVLAPANIVFAAIGVAALATWVSGVLTRSLGAVPWPHLACVGWAAFAFTLVTMFVREFVLYVDHVLVHKVPLLWEFHKVHHSAEVLTPLTNERKHPVDIVLIIGMVVVVMGLWQGLVVYLLFDQVTVTKLFGLDVTVAVFHLAGAHLRHSHVWLSYGRVLDRIVISPALHQIHHSAALQHRDRNFGETLAIFDWMFGTLYQPAERETLKFGVDTREQAAHTGLAAAYLRPFVAAGRSSLAAVRLR